MRKMNRIRSSNFDQFVGSLSRVLGIPRKNLEKFIYVRLEPSTSRQSSTRRKSSRPSDVLAR